MQIGRSVRRAARQLVMLLLAISPTRAHAAPPDGGPPPPPPAVEEQRPAPRPPASRTATVDGSPVGARVAPPTDADGAEADARRQLAALRASFSRRPRAEIEAALDDLARRLPSAPSATRALLWRADLALAAGRRDDALARYDEARRRFPNGELGALAARGEGSVALAQRRFGDAIAAYDAALAIAPPRLRAELVIRRHLATVARVRAVAEVACAALVIGCVLFYARRVRRGGGWRAMRLPPELLYTAPLYALLLVGAAGRDAGVMRALAWLGGGSLLLIGVAFAAPRPSPTTRALVAELALLTLANAAIAYVALSRAELIDVLWETLVAGPDAS